MGRIGMVDLCFVRCIFMSCFIFKGKRIIFLFFFLLLFLYGGRILRRVGYASFACIWF